MSDDLIARLEIATTPDRVLDAMIDERSLGGIKRALPYVPYYTALMDHAVQAVPQGREWEIGSAQLIGIYWAAVINPHFEHKGQGKTPAIALCIAAMKARNERSKQ